MQALRRRDPGKLVLVVRVGTPDTVEALADCADAVIGLETPTAFLGVGQFHENFGQLDDEDAVAYLDVSTRFDAGE